MTESGTRITGTGNFMAIAHANTPTSEPNFKVVVNSEGQYSLWPADREAPQGWSEVGHSGPKAGCLAFVDEVWKDMRPVSLREAMV